MNATTNNESRIADHGLGIYIHWPYCLSKCPYCDFFSQPLSKEWRHSPRNLRGARTARALARTSSSEELIKQSVQNDQDQLIDSYLEDLDFYHNLTSDRTVTSIFFGGGTPSLIKPSNIEKLITHIFNKWKTTPNPEITLEANPNSTTDHRSQITDIHSAGVNRLSLGIQALNDPDLKFLGRTHTLNQALTSIDQVLKTFDNHSIDLIYARPNQTSAAWQQELEQAANFGFKHLSLYQLTIEEGTPFYKQGIESLEETQALELYNFTETYLKTKGYSKYEVSNYSQPGFESTHNQGYWQGRDYIGIGPSAHGRISKMSLRGAKGDVASVELAIGEPLGEDRALRGHRAERVCISANYIATTHPRILEPLTPAERAAELLLMGLRLTEGIDKKSFQSQCGLDLNHFINQTNLSTLKTQNLIEETQTHLKATPQGFLLLNKIIEQLIP